MPLIVNHPHPHVTLITIDNQAKRNAMSRAMLNQLAGLWDELDQSTCRCVVLTGAGEKAFCAGADLGGDLSASEDAALSINRSLLKNSTFSKPIISAINGDCAGGGLELLLSTDIRFTAPHARFGLPEVRYSIYPFGGSTVKLMQQIGYVHAMDLLFTGRLVDAKFACDINLVNEVVTSENVLDKAIATAVTIASNSPPAVQAVKQQISATIADHAMSREALEQVLGDRVRAAPEFSEGVAAFREKRQPNYE
ncbi:MAG: enoyl-CoA hydratase [Gammaproteobacteria bacterium]|jgi:enoyl-CoA hydratase